MTEIKWHPSTAIPESGTKAFVIWLDTNRLHTALWLDGRWFTSSGYTVHGMGEVQAWARQPSVESCILFAQDQANPTDPGHDVDAPRENLEHLDRRVRQSAQEKVEPFRPDVYRAAQTAWKIGYDTAKAEMRSSVDKAVNRTAKRQPLTDEEVTALFNKLCNDRSAWPDRRYRDFARWVESAHGIGEEK